MKIEMTISHYATATGFKLTGTGEHEVDDERGRKLLETYPDWFKAVEGEETGGSEPVNANQEEAIEEPEDELPEVTGAESEGSDQEDDEPEAPQNEAEEPQPTKGLSKVNKDELLALAGELGVEANAEMTNKKLVEAIKAKQEFNNQ